ncbi:zinc-binding dehydrogenase [Rubrobacter marinus]|uniref:zinc-binding dehydrogenase n=1 Tax=Rubrobacter marinus TaxID=2653852 RepID=UPI00140A131D|nr:zinc-binding dehydrogenase [Rubrobacter marinus]
MVVLGAGNIGLFTVAALRRLTEAGRILVVAKHERQRGEALRLGADEVFHPGEVYGALPEALGATVHKPELGKPVVLGGAERVFECVGSPGTIEDATRLCAPSGEVMLVGMPGARSSLDLTPLWHGEVRLTGAYAYGIEERLGEEPIKSFELALRMAPEIKLDSLVGPRFRLREYREAIAAARASGRRGHVKVVFDHR